MQHLRLVGVHEDGLHLLLADDDGARFSLPLDEALRTAARRDRPRLGQLQIETTGGLRPKDVQAMIRAGMTTEEVAERAGWPVEKVHRYEGPILAEREHIAGLARQVRLRPRGGSHGAAPTLETRVTERLRTREIDGGNVRWDSRRTDRSAWTVLLLFNAGGRQREAAWTFDPLARTVSAMDDEARWLSEDEDQQAPGPIPAPHLAASSRPSRVYDVEAEGGVSAPTPRRREGETVDLMAAMRERSAQRRRRRPKSAEVPGLDDAPEEALPLQELAVDPRDELPPPAHTHPEDDPDVVKTGTLEDRVGVEVASRKARTFERTQPVRQAGHESPAPGPNGDGREGDGITEANPVADSGRGPEADIDPDTATACDAGVETEAPALRPAVNRRRRPRPVTDDVVEPADRTERPESDDHDDVISQRVAAPAAKPRPRPSTAARKSGRPSVPSWDDIMFGRKNE